MESCWGISNGSIYTQYLMYLYAAYIQFEHAKVYVNIIIIIHNSCTYLIFTIRSLDNGIAAYFSHLQVLFLLTLEVKPRSWI